MSSVPVKRENHVKAFVALQHAQQRRKYTGEPYLFHLVNVAENAAKYVKFGYEIGLCHDLLEDTETTVEYLIDRLVFFGYTDTEVNFIATCVTELTDVYTHEAFPEYNRAKRKAFEAQRLYNASYTAQTVKYFDLMDNTISIVEHDKGFAVKYLAEKEMILAGMTAGNHKIYQQCLNVLRVAQAELKNQE